MPSSATPTSDVDTPASVFGGGVRLAEAEIESITRALMETVVPMSTSWTEQVGHAVEVAVGAISPGPLPRPAELEPDPTASILDDVADAGSFVAVGLLGGDLGIAAMVIPAPLGLAAVDLLLGGTGRPSGDRTLSAIDLDLLRSVAPPTFSALRFLGPAAQVDEPVPLLDDLEEADLAARIQGGVTVALELTLAEQTHELRIVLSANAARSLTGGATVAAADAPAENSRATIAGVLSDVLVEAVVTFPPVLVPSHRILALDVGDVIGLGTTPDHPLPLTVDGHHLADVRPARAGADVACQVVSTTVGSDADRFHDPHQGGLQ